MSTMRDNTASRPQVSPPISLVSISLSPCKSILSSKSRALAPNERETSDRCGQTSPDIWGVQLVSRAYRDVPYAPVDPWKPSLMYSIRHIHPECSSPGETPSASPHMEHAKSPPLTPQFAEQTKSLNEFVDYPFSQNSPRVSTTRPLGYPAKHREWNITTGDSTDSHCSRRSYGSRYFWPYPSPTGAPRSASSIYNHPAQSPWQRDRHDKHHHQESSVEYDVQNPSPIPSLSAFRPAVYPVVGAHSRGTSASQTVADGGAPHDPANFLPTIPRIHQSHHDSYDGTTVVITPNHHHLRHTPKLDQPPPPRSRSGSIAHPQDGQPISRWSTNSNSSSRLSKSKSKSFATKTYIFAFLLDTLPRQIYLYFLLFLPSMYFSRVAHVFETAEMSLPKIKQSVIEYAKQAEPHGPSPSVSAYVELQKSWEQFIDSLMREWRTLNIISVLLLSAILAILQIESAINDPVTVYVALLSMMCALMSLIYGCIYIIRFGSMRKVSKAAMWAAEAQRSTTCILWNVWVFLAMPAAWLAWSMVLYIACVMSLVWRLGSEADSKSWTLTPSQAMFPRATITAVLVLGAVYFALIMNTLRRYGHMMDRAWKKLTSSWIHSRKSPHFPHTPTRKPRFSHALSPLAAAWVRSKSDTASSEKSHFGIHEQV